MGVGQVEQQDEARRALDQGAHSRASVTTDDQVTFPMAGYGTVVGLSRALADMGVALLE
jgi:hypothetical protein